MFQVEICSQQLESANPCACLSSSPLLWRLINFRLFCSDDFRSWPRDEKINTFLTMIIEESVSFMSCEPFFWVQLFLCGTCGIYFYLHPTFFPSIEQSAWVIISPKEFTSWVTCISFALLYGKTELSAVKYFAICS